MVEEVVVTDSLSSEMIAAGEELIGQLDRDSFAVSAALWFYLPEPGVWRLMIAHPKLKSEGPKKAYRQVQYSIGKIPSDRPRISLKDVTVIDSKEKWLSSLRAAVPFANGVTGFRIYRNLVDGILIDDAYIYRLARIGG